MNGVQSLPTHQAVQPLGLYPMNVKYQRLGRSDQQTNLTGHYVLLYIYVYTHMQTYESYDTTYICIYIYNCIYRHITILHTHTHTSFRQLDIQYVFSHSGRIAALPQVKSFQRQGTRWPGHVCPESVAVSPPQKSHFCTKTL